VTLITAKLYRSVQDCSAGDENRSVRSACATALADGVLQTEKGIPTMKRSKNDPKLAELPAPITLTPDQLAAVASDTGAVLGAGGGYVPVIIAGGIRVPT
jgi:hypothetical protein